VEEEEEKEEKEEVMVALYSLFFSLGHQSSRQERDNVETAS
jgi:hypothetical protein